MNSYREKIDTTNLSLNEAKEEVSISEGKLIKS